MNPEQIQFIYFDLDDTLLDHRQAERRGLADVHRAYAAHFGRLPVETLQTTYHAQSVPLWRQYAHGKISKHDLQRLRFEQTLHALGIDGLDARMLNGIYLDYYARYWTLLKDAENAFYALADQFPVGILTNGFAEVQHAKFDRFPVLRERAKVLLISEEVGYMKPHPKLFAHAATAAETPVDTILYVGDSYTSDVQGALNAGWQIAWYTNGKTETGMVNEETVFQFDQWEDLTKAILGKGI